MYECPKPPQARSLWGEMHALQTTAHSLQTIGHPAARTTAAASRTLAQDHAQPSASGPAPTRRTASRPPQSESACLTSSPTLAPPPLSRTELARLGALLGARSRAGIGGGGGPVPHGCAAAGVAPDEERDSGDQHDRPDRDPEGAAAAQAAGTRGRARRGRDRRCRRGRGRRGLLWNPGRERTCGATLGKRGRRQRECDPGKNRHDPHALGRLTTAARSADIAPARAPSRNHRRTAHTARARALTADIAPARAPSRNHRRTAYAARAVTSSGHSRAPHHSGTPAASRLEPRPHYRSDASGCSIAGVSGASL